MSAARPIHALAAALGVTEQPRTEGPTVDVAGAARLLHVSIQSIYSRRRDGKLPRPIQRRPLVWRVADLLDREA